MATRLLVIDDDAELGELVAKYLAVEGFTVDVGSGRAADVDRALAGGYALVVLDVMLPNVSGFDLLRRIRASSALPVLMLTAKGDALDRVLGLELGADDYLPKPFNPQELAARIRAILRRTTPRIDTGPADPIVVGDLEVDPGARLVRRHGTAVPVTTVEFDLLETLTRATGQVISREALVRDVLGREFSPFDRSIDTHIYNLRKKIGPHADGTERIKGVRGVGYLYARPGAAGS
ncbi:MAG TPA: response regulator transcription factor [Vicinamibacterales bacterium]|nr:response regulator transcription factor [Vicinamibacterales bacterium]